MAFKFLLIIFLIYFQVSSFEIIKNQKSGEKIVNGQIVASREIFPHNVAMLIKKTNVKDFILCGGKNFN